MFALTTTDNKWSPITHFPEWNAFDVHKGYHTCERLARIAHTSPIFSDEKNDEIIAEAMDVLIEENYPGIITDGKAAYRKITA